MTEILIVTAVKTWSPGTPTITFLVRLCYDIVACKAVAMQRPLDGRIYQGPFWATAR
jgi:hypothetical protein